LSFKIANRGTAIWYEDEDEDEDEMGGACSVNGGEKKRLKVVGWKTRRKEPNRKTKT
jgi:hypothetical protein